MVIEASTIITTTQEVSTTTINNPGINLVDNFFHYNEEPGISIYSYEIGSAMDMKNEHTNLTFIEFSDAQKRQLLKKFHINEDEKLYVYISDTPSDERMATSNYDYIFMLENGTRLDLSDLKEDFTVSVSVPIRDLDLANFDHAIQFSEKGYDIYDKKSDFYINPCTPAYIHKDDIPIKDRKKDIYPNVTLCKGSNCHYKNVNLDDRRIVCECNLNADKINETEDNDDFMEDDDNVGNYILDNINYKIIRCYYLLLNFNNLKYNPAFYVIIVIFCVVMFCCLKFALFGIQKIRISMYNELPTEQKVREQVIEELKKKKKNNLETIVDSPPKKEKPGKKGKKPRNKNIVQKKRSENVSLKLKESKERESQTISEFYQTDNFKKKNRIDSSKGNYISNKTINPTNADLINAKSESESDLEREIDKPEEDYSKSPYTQALREDKRKCCSLFCSLLFEKLDFLNLWLKNDFFKTILICNFLTSLLIDFFFNSFLYSDDVVSRKYHNNGQLDFIVTLALSIISSIFTAIIMKYLERTYIFEEWIKQIKEIKKEYKYLFALNKFLKYLKIQMCIFITIEIIIILWAYYYIVIFFIIYSQSRKSLILNFIISLLEEIIKSLIVIVAIVLTRRIGLICKNSYIYNTSKFIDENF